MSPDRARREGPPPFDVVAIGASAGGVEALHVIVAALPANFPVPVLIVQHMDPRHKSMLAGLLGRRSKLRVKHAEDALRRRNRELNLLPEIGQDLSA